MSNSKSEIRKGLARLDVGTPYRIPKLPAFGLAMTTPAQTHELPHSLESQTQVLTTQTSREKPNLEQTVSKIDSVRILPCAPSDDFAEKHSDIARRVSSSDSVKNEPCQKLAESKADTVKIEHCEKLIGSEFDPVVTTEAAKARPLRKGFSQVPNILLRGECPFSEPVDLMVYLHLFTFSHGFNRETAQMGLTEIERFTHASRNTVKKSLERLQKTRWIEMVEDYEFGRVSRRWKVRLPEDLLGESPQTPLQKLETKIEQDHISTVSKTDSVKVEPRQNLTLSEGENLMATGSKIDPNKYNTNKYTNNSLSTPALDNYFASLKPEKKREREFREYQELQKDFSPSRIETAFTHLSENGIPGSGEQCHSPMAFLSNAIGAVLVLADEQAVAQRRRLEAQEAALRARSAEALAAIEEDREFAEKEKAFLAAFSGDEERASFISDVARRFPLLKADGPVVRNLAISEWFAGPTA